MAHDPGPSHGGGDKILPAERVLTSDSAAEHGPDDAGGKQAPIQDYDVERVEKVYRCVYSLS